MGFIGRIGNVGERVPEWLRPTFYGAAIVGAICLAKLVLLLPFMQGNVRVTQLILTWLLAVAAGAVAGSVWTFANRWLLPIPAVGPYLTGVTTVSAYMAAGVVAFTWFGGVPRPEGLAAVIGFGSVSLVVGLLLGHALRD